jgi:hypothetical protein
MKKFFVLVLFLYTTNGFCQIVGQQQIKTPDNNPKTIKSSGSIRTAKRPGTSGKSTIPASYPSQNPSSKNVVYQYIDTTYPNSENHFPLTGNAGIGTNTPQAAMEIRRNAGDTRKKNVLLQLSNEWSPNGQNEPSIMFSNGDISSLENVSYWTIGARVSGDKTLNTPQTFKISHKPVGSNIEQEFFSVDSYQGRVKIGDVNTNVDGYKLYVEQGILTEKVKVAIKNSDDWFDHVLKQDYKLIPLSDLDKYIKTNNHLPDIPTTEEVMKNGLDLGKMNGLLLKKVEELTRYIIDIKNDLDQTKKELEIMKTKVEKVNK